MNREDVLKDWFVEGVHRGAKYLIVVSDPLEQEERPIYVFPEQDITLETQKLTATALEISDIINILNNSPGIKVTDDPKNNIYPMPVSSANRDEVFVGRIRRDPSRKNCLNLWIVSDNIRKGAATNAVQIAEYMLNQGFI